MSKSPRRIMIDPDDTSSIAHELSESYSREIDPDSLAVNIHAGTVYAGSAYMGSLRPTAMSDRYWLILDRGMSAYGTGTTKAVAFSKRFH